MKSQTFPPSLLYISAWLLIFIMFLLHQSEAPGLLQYSLRWIGLLTATVFLCLSSTLILLNKPVRMIAVLTATRDHSPDRLVLLINGLCIGLIFLVYSLGYYYADIHTIPGYLSVILFWAFFTSGSEKFRAHALSRTLLIGIGLLLTFIPIELFLRTAGRVRVWSPEINTLFIPAADVMPGIEGESRFTTDDLGIRGVPYRASTDFDIRILTIGGSTTETLYLDDEESWAYLLQDQAQEDGVSLWVGNVGRSGHKTLDHFLVLHEFVPELELDAVIIMAGVNDMASTLQAPERDHSRIGIPESYRDIDRDSLSTFAERPYQFSVWHRGGVILFDLILHTADSLLSDPGERGDAILIEDQAGERYIDRRLGLQNAPLVLDSLPDGFEDGVEVYRHNLITLVSEARGQGLSLILVTQPSVWGPEMPPAFEPYLWLGFYGDKNHPAGRYTSDVLYDGMSHYNQVMLAVCDEMAVFCVDLAAEMDGVPAYFYDDVHFNEAGARFVAETIWSAIDTTCSGDGDLCPLR